VPGLVSISFSNETGRGGTPRLQVLLHASSQSAFHFSIALLFRYRSCVKVFGLGRNTPPSASVCIHKQVYSLGRKRPKRVSPHEEKGATIKFAYLSCSSKTHNKSHSELRSQHPPNKRIPVRLPKTKHGAITLPRPVYLCEWIFLPPLVFPLTLNTFSSRRHCFQADFARFEDFELRKANPNQ